MKGWKPGEVLVVDADALGCPTPLPRLEPGSYYAQAVMDFDRGDRSFAAAEGNGYSKLVHTDLDPDSTGAGGPDHRPGVPRPALQRDGSRQARRYREQAADRLPRPADADAGRRRAAARRSSPIRIEVSGRLRDPRLRRHHFGAFSPGRATPRTSTASSALRHARSELPARPSRLRRLGQQRAVRPGADRGADPGDREEVPRPGQAGRPVRDRPFLRRLEQPVAAGRLSRLLRRRLVHVAGPGRFPRLPAHRPDAARRQHVHRRRRQAAAAGRGPAASRCSISSPSPTWKR